MKAPAEKKKVALFDPQESSRALLVKLLERLGFSVEEHQTAKEIASRSRGKQAVDLLVVNLAALGDTYQEVTGKMEALDLAAAGAPPLIAVTSLSISLEARERLERLGARAIYSKDAPLMELVFAVNRLLFPKIRELRRYTRVFGGFPVKFLHQGQWRDGEVFNISQEGAFIQCPGPPRENSLLPVGFVLPGLEVSMRVQAQVNWVNRPSGEPDPLSPEGMGVSFLTLNQEESTSLDRFIAGRVNGNDPSGASSSSCWQPNGPAR